MTTPSSHVLIVFFPSKHIYFGTKLQLAIAKDQIPWLTTFFSFAPTCYLA